MIRLQTADQKSPRTLPCAVVVGRSEVYVGVTDRDAQRHITAVTLLQRYASTTLWLSDSSMHAAAEDRLDIAFNHRVRTVVAVASSLLHTHQSSSLLCNANRSLKNKIMTDVGMRLAPNPQPQSRLYATPERNDDDGSQLSDPSGIASGKHRRGKREARGRQCGFVIRNSFPVFFLFSKIQAGAFAPEMQLTKVACGLPSTGRAWRLYAHNTFELDFVTVSL